jgi:putative ABC transport system ATP-binding protein
MASMIDLDGTTKTYLLGEVEVPVLRGIDLTLKQGEYVAIMGMSGSGKSTLMNILGYLDCSVTRQPLILLKDRREQ